MKTIAIIILLFMCVSCTPIIAVDTFCEIYRPIMVDAEQDTVETLRQILVQNKIYEERCK